MHGLSITSFNVSVTRILFKDQYLELSTSVPSDADLYGLGEVTLPTGFLLPRNGRTITLWTKDVASAEPYTNLYGAHPFYLQVNQGAPSVTLSGGGMICWHCIKSHNRLYDDLQNLGMFVCVLMSKSCVNAMQMQMVLLTECCC
jgi:alpha-glucosidase (family GH31 glycosyl hydrolase)